MRLFGHVFHVSECKPTRWTCPFMISFLCGMRARRDTAHTPDIFPLHPHCSQYHLLKTMGYMTGLQLQRIFCHSLLMSFVWTLRYCVVCLWINAFCRHVPWTPTHNRASCVSDNLCFTTTKLQICSKHVQQKLHCWRDENKIKWKNLQVLDADSGCLKPNFWPLVCFASLYPLPTTFLGDLP